MEGTLPITQLPQAATTEEAATTDGVLSSIGPALQSVLPPSAGAAPVGEDGQPTTTAQADSSILGPAFAGPVLPSPSRAADAGVLGSIEASPPEPVREEVPFVLNAAPVLEQRASDAVESAVLAHPEVHTPPPLPPPLPPAAVAPLTGGVLTAPPDHVTEGAQDEDTPAPPLPPAPTGSMNEPAQQKTVEEKESLTGAANPTPTDDHTSGGDSANDTAAITMKDLFGALFQMDTTTAKQPIQDPTLVDTRSILFSHFGEFIREEDIELGETDDLTREMQANKEARHRAELERLFGVTGTDVLAAQSLEPFGMLRSSLPTPPTLGPQEEMWLVEMPKVEPNRQTMHADPQPFFPSSCTYLQSDARMLYTPYNVMRWTYLSAKKLFMSNSRIVRWSDGSSTLHIGTDVYSLQQAKSQAALHLLGNPAVVEKGPVALPSLVATVKPDRHLVLESTGAVSVERAVITESLQHRTIASKQKLGYSTATLPAIDWTKPVKGRNPYEEYVAMEYDRRQKEMARRAKEGRPMSLAEQIEMEQEMLQHLRTTSAEVLLEQQNEARREAALRVARAQDARAAGTSHRSRFDRDLGLGGDLSAFGGAELAAQEGTVDDASEDQSGSEAEEARETAADDDYEFMLNDMRRKRDREDAEERRAKVAKHEEEQRVRFAPLMSALEALVGQLPMGSDAYGSVDGTLEFLKSGSFATGIVVKEVPVMLREVADELPEVDTTAVRAAFEAIFPGALEA